MVLLMTTTILAGCTSGPSDDGSDDGSGDGSGDGGDAGGGPAAPNGMAPALSVGDMWVDKFTSAASPEVTTTTTTTVEALEEVSGGDQQHAAYRLSVEPGSITMWIRQSDHAVIKTHTDVAGFIISVDYDEPCGTNAWPLSVGMEWDVECTSSTTTTTPAGEPPAQEATTSTSYVVEAVESVTVPAGTFEAFKITYTEHSDTMETTGTMWYAPAACHAVKVEQDAPGTGGTLELQSFECAEA
jgi:hypothetical protein